MKSFVDRFDVNDINSFLWSRLCERLVKSIKESKSANCQEDKNIETFEYNAERKFEGILKHLSDRSGGNIIENGTVNITTNTVNSGHPLRNLVDFKSSSSTCYYRSNNDKRAIICFDFKNKEIQVTDYTIKTGTYGTNGGHLKSWSIDASEDGNEWTEIDHRENEQSLNGDRYSSSFNVQRKTNNFYRFIRLRQTGDTWDNDNLFEITLIEFFGKLKQ